MLNAVRLQGGLKVQKIDERHIKWDSNSENGKKIIFNSDTYNIMFLRYSDLVVKGPKSTVGIQNLGFDINTDLSEVTIAKIDADYLEKHFKILVPKLKDNNISVDDKDLAIEEFKKQMAVLTEKQQKYGIIVLNDIKNDILKVEEGKRFVDYIIEYREKIIEETVDEKVNKFGIDKELLLEIINDNPNENTLNQNLRFTNLCKTCDVNKITEYYKKTEYDSRLLMKKELRNLCLEQF